MSCASRTEGGGGWEERRVGGGEIERVARSVRLLSLQLLSNGCSFLS